MTENIVVSKSRRKREMHALQELGETLAGLPAETLARLDLPEGLREAIGEVRQISQRGALRRQRQYIGRLMREVDADTIRRQLEMFDSGSAKETAILHRTERWRERLLADEDAVQEFVSEHPQLDVQKLRTLLRNSRREAAADRPPRSFRELFRLIRACVTEKEKTRETQVQVGDNAPDQRKQ